MHKNKELRNIHQGKRCFILGNGPSLKNQDILKLKNEQTFVVNAFWNHPQYQQIYPKNYVIIDSDIFLHNGEKNYYWEDLVKKTGLLRFCPTNFFFHLIGKKFIEEANLLPSDRIFYLYTNGFLKDNLFFKTDIDEIIPNTKNVILACLFIAIYMGFEEIYLLGCEHDFLAHPAHKFYEQFEHFYKTSKYDTTNKNEIAYRKLSTASYEGRIEQAKILFKNYRLFKEKIGKTHPKVKIYNATPNSFLDVFPHVKYEDVEI